MLKPGKVINNIKIVKELKHGAQGFVYLGEDVRTFEQVVLKSAYVEESKKPGYEKVIKTWKLLGESKAKHFIVEYKFHFDVDKNSMMVMEFCPGGDLDFLIRKKQAEKLKFEETDILKVLIDGMNALDAMQKLNFIYWDVKSANLFIGKDGRIKIGDFNASKMT